MYQDQSPSYPPVKLPEIAQSPSYRTVEFSEAEHNLIQNFGLCNIFEGTWVVDDSKPAYPPGSCPFIDEAFDCFKNGKPDSDFLNWRWQPNGCMMPRFDGKKMLEMLRGKRMVFIGHSLNRNMWQSMVCALRESVSNKSRVFEVSGRQEFRTKWHYSFIYDDYNCSVEFVRSTFLVRDWEVSTPSTASKETLRLDLIDNSSSIYENADILIFNTGHWWTHEKTSEGKDYYQEGNHVYSKLDVTQAYAKALSTWAEWIDTKINPNRNQVFFRGYSASHYRLGHWNSGGRCDNETITNYTDLNPYLWLMDQLELTIRDMKTPVWYLNITTMSDYRRDAHPSPYRVPEAQRTTKMVHDCSHWCLPGVPDAWNELIYASLLSLEKSQEDLLSNDD